METIEYRGVIDKSDWGAGPWQDEPDKKQWRDEATGLPCLIVRNGGITGSLCGYVGVPREHPAHSKHYDDVDVDVHGGLTFASACGHGADPARGICHIPGNGEPDDVWWLGFDCAHCDDITPAMAARERARGWDDLKDQDAQYRDLAYVEAQCATLAAQLSLAVNFDPDPQPEEQPDAEQEVETEDEDSSDQGTEPPSDEAA